MGHLRVPAPAVGLLWITQRALADVLLLPCPTDCSDENPCEGLSRHATFTNFGMAFLTLFRVSTGDNWNGIMKVCAVSGDFLFWESSRCSFQMDLGNSWVKTKVVSLKKSK